MPSDQSYLYFWTSWYVPQFDVNEGQTEVLLNYAALHAMCYPSDELEAITIFSPYLDWQIFRFSVWRGHPTPGSVLMNLRYRDEASCRPVSNLPPTFPTPPCPPQFLFYESAVAFSEEQ